MRSAKRSLCATMLLLEAIVLGLTTPVLIGVEAIAVGTALAVGLGLALACLVVAASLRHTWAYAAGWVIQVAALALGAVVPAMIVLGVGFTALWAGAVALGGKVDRERAEREALEH